eukprot:1572932-Heterocapsa_arctica.AAC.1
MSSRSLRAVEGLSEDEWRSSTGELLAEEARGELRAEGARGSRPLREAGGEAGVPADAPPAGLR